MIISKQINGISFFKYFLIAVLLLNNTKIQTEKSHPENEHVELNVPFISQLDQTYLRYESCGPACVMMMLLYHVQHNKLPLSALSDYKKLCINLNTTSAQGTYFRDVLAYFTQNNYQHRTLFFQSDELAMALKKGPIMVLIYEKPQGLLSSLIAKISERILGKIGHFIVLTGANKNGFVYFNPLYSKRSHKYKQCISYEEFNTIWTGTACQLLI